MNSKRRRWIPSQLLGAVLLILGGSCLYWAEATIHSGPDRGIEIEIRNLRAAASGERVLVPQSAPDKHGENELPADELTAIQQHMARDAASKQPTPLAIFGFAAAMTGGLMLFRPWRRGLLWPWNRIFNSASRKH